MELRAGSEVEQNWRMMRSFPGKVIGGEEGKALTVAKAWKDKAQTVWTDGSRLDNGRSGAAVVWWEEAFALYQALKTFEVRNEAGSVTRLFDSTAAHTGAMSDRIGLGQDFAWTIAEAVEWPVTRSPLFGLVSTPLGSHLSLKC